MQWIFLFVCDCLHRSLNLFIILKDSCNFVNNTLPANSLKLATRMKKRGMLHTYCCSPINSKSHVISMGLCIQNPEAGAEQL